MQTPVKGTFFYKRETFVQRVSVCVFIFHSGTLFLCNCDYVNLEKKGRHLTQWPIVKNLNRPVLVLLKRTQEAFCQYWQGTYLFVISGVQS